MDNPTLDGRSIGHASNYSSGMNVHFSSGVFNRAFYLLSNTAGWNIRQAFDVYVEANRMDWGSRDTFNQAGKGVYDAAKRLGYCVDDVVTSLDTVGVTSGSKTGAGCGGSGPTADFGYSANQLSVSFTDKSTDDQGIVNYAWSFGDNATSSSANPSHTYSAQGSYTVSLTVTDGDNLTDTKSMSVSVTTEGNAPIADFSYSTNDLNASFTDKSSDDGAVVSYQWDFGDNTSSTLQNPSHTFTASGSYDVSLTVTDDDNLTGSKSMSVTVSVTGECEAAWSASTNYSIGDVVTYNGTRYEAIWWSTGAQPDVFSQVWKNIGDCSGGTNKAPEAGFQFTSTELVVSFSDQSSDDKGVVSHAWNFGDGTSSTDENPTHTYSTAGSYSTQLTVKDTEGLSDTVTKTVTVSTGPGGCNATAWNASSVYLNGDQVSQNSNLYQANWWNQNKSPEENSGPWQVWSLIGPCNQ